MEVDSESDAFNNVMNRSREVAEEAGEPPMVEEAEDVTFETFTSDGVAGLRLFKKMDCS